MRGVMGMLRLLAAVTLVAGVVSGCSKRGEGDLAAGSGVKGAPGAIGADAEAPPPGSPAMKGDPSAVKGR